ncbi:MAG: TonB-dependent receptor [Melioribacteraceae bacterium]|nr:TonB-dependent receptor [Melioribacteraceae bacterium]
MLIDYREKINLTISMIGYQSKEIPLQLSAGKHHEIEVSLKSGIIEMGSIVVTGTNTPHLYSEVPVKTEIINRLSIERKHAVNLAEALNLQTGLSVDNECNNCNFTQVRILGFDGKYTQILIDGDPVVSSLGGVYGLEHYPREMIEQIEIVKGGGSSLYGAGAISGTVNLMTRRPSFNQTRIGYLGSSINGAFDQQLGAVAELVSDDGKTGAFIFGSTRSRSPYDHNNDGFTELGRLNHETIGFNFYHRPGSTNEIKLSVHRIHEDRRGGSDLEKPIHESRIGEWTEHFKWGGKATWTHKLSEQFDYKVNYAFSFLKRDSYYGGMSENTPEGRLEALKYYGYSENPLHNGGVQANYRLDNHTVIAGFQFLRDEILDESVSSEAYYIDEVFTNYGFFLQDEWSLSDNKNAMLVYGVRVDKHSKLENAVLSPRINLKYTLFDGMILRAGYTTGFKAPQIFDEDLHICGLEGEQRVIRNDPNLSEERSHSFSGGFEFQNFVGEIPLLAGVTAFYTKLNDAYAEEFVKSEPTFDLWRRINSSGAEVMGVEIDLGVKPSNHLEIRSGLTLKQNQYEEELPDFNTKNFLKTPDMFGHLSIMYEVSESIDFYSALKYTGSMYMPHEVVVDGADEPDLLLETTDEFFILDAGVSLDIKIVNNFRTKLSVGIKNLTNAYQNDLDRGINRDPGYTYGTSQPRTFYFGIDTSF